MENQRPERNQAEVAVSRSGSDARKERLQGKSQVVHEVEGTGGKTQKLQTYQRVGLSRTNSPFLCEVVILSKMILDKKKMAHDSHRSIMNSLKEVDNDLRVAYKTLLDFSRDIRYERLSITEKMREDFLKAYYSFKVRIQKMMG